MKLRKLILIFILLFVALTGCVGKTVILQNSEGQIATCEVGAGATFLTGTIIRDMTLNECVSQYEAIGFNRVQK